MIYIHYNNGRVLHGVVLALGDRKVRVAIKDSADAMEFRLVNQVWVSEDCEVVRVQFAEGSAPGGLNADPLDSLLGTCLPAPSTLRVM